jgi:WD40 repeat protein/serine/threonine protein kinase
MQTLIGRTLKGFEIQEEIGTGGAAIVYRAFQRIVDRKVAIKVILPKYANEPEFIRRFDSEAQIVAKIEHPFIVPLYDYWRDPNGAYLVMRWLQGGNLRKLLNEHGAVPVQETLKFINQIASALQAAHKAGVVHRDLKPDNILLDVENNAYLTDFGIAKLIGEQLPGNTFAGSIAYVAPEQITGNSPTPQADIYSFGVMIYEILTGQHPFPNTTITELLLHHTHDPLPDIRTINPQLSDEFNLIIQQSTAKDPSDRYQDVRELMQAFYQLEHETSEQAAVMWSSETPTTNPYKGLRAFQESDAADFFGREAFVSEMLKRLRQGEKFLSIVGPSGSGKSSAIRAGLIPALRNGTISDGEALYIADFIPGIQPITALAEALISVSPIELPNLEEQLRDSERGLIWAVDNILQNDDGEVLLFIDQFEEVFILVQDEAERERFLNSIYTITNDPESRLRVIITLRADFYDRPLMYENFGKLIQQHTQVVLPLSANEIERAIVGPAQRVGLKVDTQLIAAMVGDVREEPGALPLLQYALTELFEQSTQEGQLSHTVYEQSGGIYGVLAKRANELYEKLTAEQQELARQIFLRLVQPGDGTEDTRRRTGRTVLQHLSPDKQTLDTVLEHFGKARLLTFDIDSITREPMVEVAHEALIRQWGRLHSWLDQSRDDLRLHYKLVAALQEWQTNKFHDDFLLSGGRLAQFEDWSKHSPISLSPDEQSLLDASVERRNVQLAAEEARRQHELDLQQESIRRLRYLIGAVVIIAVLGILMAITSNAASKRATHAQATAEANESRAIAAESTAVRRGDEAQSRILANRLPSIALSDPSIAYGLAIALLEKMDSPPTSVRAAANDLFFNTHVIRQYTGHNGPISHVAFSPDGNKALSGTVSGEIFLWDVKTGEILRSYEGHSAWVRTIAFSPDGQTALSSSNDQSMILWDVETAEILRRYEGHNTWVIGAVFSPDGSRILSGALDGKVMLWDTATGEIIYTLEGHHSWVWELAYAPDGKTGLSASDDGRLIWWDLETGEQLDSFEEHDGGITAVAYSPDGKSALSGSYDGTMILRDLETKEILQIYEEQRHIIWSVAFSPNGEFILSAGEDGSVFFWDTDQNNARYNFHGHVMPATSVAFSPDGLQALSASEDGTLLLWDIDRITKGPFFEGHMSIIDSVSVSPDGKYALSASWDGTLRKWDLETGEVVRVFIGHVGQILGHAYAPDGRTIISGDRDGTTIIWNAENGSPLFIMQEHQKDVTCADYTPDGQMAITGSWDKTLILWDIHTGAILRTFEGHTARINAVSISPDGQTVLSASDDGTLTLWDIHTGAILRTFIGHRGRVMGVDFAPDGQTAISSSADGRLLLWDVVTGQAIREFVGHSRLVDAVAFAPDGQTAISSSADASLILWDIQTGEALRHLLGHSQWVSGVAYTPDGTHAISSSGDFILILWAIILPDEELITWARENRVIAELGCPQYMEYGVPTHCTD